MKKFILVPGLLFVLPLFARAVTTLHPVNRSDKFLTDEQIAQDQFQSIVISDVAFTNTTLPEIVAYVIKQSREFPDRYLTLPGVSVICVADEETKKIPLNITLSGTNLLDLLKLVCLKTGLKFRMDGNVAVLSRQGSTVITRSYLVNPSTLACTPFISKEEGYLITLPFSISFDVSYSKGRRVTYSATSIITLANGVSQIFWLSSSGEEQGSEIAVVLTARMMAMPFCTLHCDH